MGTADIVRFLSPFFDLGLHAQGHFEGQRRHAVHDELAKGLVDARTRHAKPGNTA